MTIPTCRSRHSGDALQQTHARHRLLGHRRLPEIGIVGTAEAVSNAVYNATGVRVRDLPITLDKLLSALPDRAAPF